MGPNEVDIKDLQSLPNASEKDGAAPAIQKYAEPPKKQVGSQHLLFHSLAQQPYLDATAAMCA